MGVWWERWGIIRLDFLKVKEMLNGHLYVQQLQRVDKSFVEKYPLLVDKKIFFSMTTQGCIQQE